MTTFAQIALLAEKMAATGSRLAKRTAITEAISTADGKGPGDARFEVQPPRLVRGFGFLQLDLNVLGAGNDLAAFLLLAYAVLIRTASGSWRAAFAGTLQPSWLE